MAENQPKPGTSLDKSIFSFTGGASANNFLGGGLMEAFQRTTDMLTSSSTAGSLSGMIDSLMRDMAGNDSDDEETGTEETSDFTWSSKLTLALESKDKAERLLRQGNYYEAYGVMQALEGSGEEFRDILFLLRYYSSLVLTNRSVQAEMVFGKLLETFRKNYITMPENFLKAADKLRKDKKYIESICLCRIAASCYVNSDSGQVDVTLLQCLQGITRSLHELTDFDASLRLTAMQNIVPRALDIFRRARSVKRILNKHTKRMESIAFHCMEVCQLCVKDHENRNETLKEAIAFMEDSFDAKVHEMELYGSLLHNLGSGLLALTKVEEAENCFARAIEVFLNVTDSTPQEKQRHINESQEMLERTCKW